MYRIREGSAQFVGFNEATGKVQKLVHVDCDTNADLPAYNAEPGTEFVMGSTALSIATGDTFMMDSTHTWKAW